jgi:serine/threonine-protein kinase RsbW
VQKELTVRATLESLEPISEFVTAAAAAAGLDEPGAYRLLLAVHELATNAIVHGYSGQELAELKLSLQLDEANLYLYLEDTAVAFDPCQAPLPDDLDKPLDERRVGGLGIYLARCSADDLRYQRIGPCNQTLIVMKRLLP